MLAAKGLLDALSDDKISDEKNQNQDYDFEKVLDFVVMILVLYQNIK